MNAALGNVAASPTKAWLFWSIDGLHFAFDVEDITPASAEPSANEHDLDAQDRVELFLWSGSRHDSYYCIEVGRTAAVHDYKARFYRRFDDQWTPKGMKVKVNASGSTYTVEGMIPKARLVDMGFHLQAGTRWRGGLFRADYDKLGGQPTWITWVNAQTKEPDFHIAGSFGWFYVTD